MATAYVPSEKVKKALYAKKIEEALWDRWHKNHDVIVLNMKSGNVVTIKVHHRRAHFSCRRWHSARTWYEVTQTATDEVRYFKFLDGIAKAIAYGFIK